MRGMAHFPNSMVGEAVRAAVLIMFFGALRQSEVAPPSIRPFDPTRHPTRADLKVTTRGATLTIKWAKNMQKVGQQRKVVLPLSQDTRICPVRAIMANVRAVPTRTPRDPLIVFPDSALPVPCTMIKKTWDAALLAAGVDLAKYTLHSLRKLSATQAHAQGCTEVEIQAHGGWHSAAYKTYIGTRIGRVTEALLDSTKQ